MSTLTDSLTGRARMAGTTNTAAACRFAVIVAGLDDEDRAAVLDALTARDAGGRRVTGDEPLAAALRNAGHPVSHATIRRHALGCCACPTITTAKDSA